MYSQYPITYLIKLYHHTVLRLNFGPKNWNLTLKANILTLFGDENSNQNFDFLKNELEFCFSNNLLVEQCVLCDKDTYFRNFERVSRECHKVYDWEISEMQGEAIFNWMQFLTLWNSLAQSGPNHLHCMYHSFLYSQRKFSQDCHGIFFSSIVTAVTDNHMIYRMSYVSEIWNSLAIRVQLNVFGMLMICNTFLELHYHNVL